VNVAATAAAVFAFAGTAFGQGACCANDGSCTSALNADCLAAGGIYRGDGVACGSIPCGVATLEIEPNENKAAATPVNFANPGDYIRGNSTGTATTPGGNSIDFYLVTTPSMDPGIYRHRLTLQSSGPMTNLLGNINGKSQNGYPVSTAAAVSWPVPGGIGTPGTTDSAFQTAFAPSPNQWYGFGRPSEIYYSVTGSASTTADYVARWSADPVTPTDIGTFPAGTLTITTVGQTGASQTDTDLWIYDSNFNAIDGYGNDNATTAGWAAASSTGSWLRREYSAGTYYIAITNTNLMNNKCSPSDDGNRGLNTAPVLDFPDTIINNSTSTNVNISFAVMDPTGATTQVAATKVGANDINWYRFTVTGTQQVGACCMPDGTCQSVLSSICAGNGGVFHGTGLDCAVANCPQPGACCKTDGTCTFVPSAYCTLQGGFFNAGVTCAAAQCNKFSVVNNLPGSWTDITSTGTALTLTSGTNDTGSYAYTSSVTNDLISNPSLFVSTNGMIGVQSFNFSTNQNGLPVQNPAITVRLFPMWDDLDTTAPCQVYHLATTENGVPVDIIEWFQTFHHGQTPRGNMEVKIWGAGGPALAQYLFQDLAWNWNGNSATIGVQWDLLKAFQYFKGSTDAPGGPVANNTVLSVISGITSCYANCDASVTLPVLNVADFTCFLQKFAAADPYANCDGSTQAPVLNVADFTCFLQKYSAGCQ
jgi:hypothetical protein